MGIVMHRKILIYQHAWRKEAEPTQHAIRPPQQHAQSQVAGPKTAARQPQSVHFPELKQNIQTDSVASKGQNIF